MAQPYGTVMIGRLAVPFEQLETSMRQWAVDRKVPGFRHEEVMLCDDGVTVVMTVFFDDKASYTALADNAEQTQWWTEVARPMLDGDPQWLDGHWRAAIDA
jgi:antibiotic biosynthesis monooxygenase (ABM) superfamily enzyme